MVMNNKNKLLDIPCTTIDGRQSSLAELDGRAYLVVNTASQCGFTPQYEGLESLWKTYGGKGLRVAGFPCNQFGSQEPGDEAAISSFCDTRFGVTFPLFRKVEVNGSGAHPLFTQLKEQAPGLLGSKRIKWNFTKFLVDGDGRVVKRYAPTTRPEQLVQDIEALLA